MSELWIYYMERLLDADLSYTSSPPLKSSNHSVHRSTLITYLKKKLPEAPDESKHLQFTVSEYCTVRHTVYTVLVRGTKTT